MLKIWAVDSYRGMHHTSSLIDRAHLTGQTQQRRVCCSWISAGCSEGEPLSCGSNARCFTIFRDLECSIVVSAQRCPHKVPVLTTFPGKWWLLGAVTAVRGEAWTAGQELGRPLKAVSTLGFRLGLSLLPAIDFLKRSHSTAPSPTITGWNPLKWGPRINLSTLGWFYQVFCSSHVESNACTFCIRLGSAGDREPGIPVWDINGPLTKLSYMAPFTYKGHWDTSRISYPREERWLQTSIMMPESQNCLAKQLTGCPPEGGRGKLK